MTKNIMKNFLLLRYNNGEEIIPVCPLPLNYWMYPLAVIIYFILLNRDQYRSFLAERNGPGGIWTHDLSTFYPTPVSYWWKACSNPTQSFFLCMPCSILYCQAKVLRKKLAKPVRNRKVCGRFWSYSFGREVMVLLQKPSWMASVLLDGTLKNLPTLLPRLFFFHLLALLVRVHLHLKTQERKS